MKFQFNRVLVVFLILSVIISLVGCNQSNSSDVEALRKQVESLAKENAELKNQTGNTTTNGATEQSTKSNETNSIATEAQPSSKNISLNEKVSITDVCEFTVMSVKYGDKIEPPKKAGYYHYYEIKEASNTYAEIIFDFKNLGTDSVDVSDIIDVNLKYSGKYNYTSFIVGEDSGGEDFDTFSYIDPLATGHMHAICEVPDEVSTSTGSLDCIVIVDGNEFSIKLR